MLTKTKLKRCPRCCKWKPATTEFFARHCRRADGLSTYCGPCKRKMDRSYARRNRDSAKLRAKQWREENPIKFAKSKAKWNKKNANAIDATNDLNYAITSGKLAREACLICGWEGKTHAHHFDYRNPFDVVYLCPKHHKRLHSRYLGEKIMQIIKSKKLL